MQPLLTNLEWPHLIDALKIAADDRLCLIDSMLPLHPEDDCQKDAPASSGRPRPRAIAKRGKANV
jgi:hypothetical protein